MFQKIIKKFKHHGIVYNIMVLTILKNPINTSFRSDYYPPTSILLAKKQTDELWEIIFIRYEDEEGVDAIVNTRESLHVNKSNEIVDMRLNLKNKININNMIDKFMELNDDILGDKTYDINDIIDCKNMIYLYYEWYAQKQNIEQYEKCIKLLNIQLTDQ